MTKSTTKVKRARLPSQIIHDFINDIWDERFDVGDGYERGKEFEKVAKEIDKLFAPKKKAR